MIPDLALIVGTYIATRMLQLLAKREPKEHGLVAFAAMVTLVVTLFAVGDILRRGTDLTAQIPTLLGR